MVCDDPDGDTVILMHGTVLDPEPDVATLFKDQELVPEGIRIPERWKHIEITSIVQDQKSSTIPADSVFLFDGSRLVEADRKISNLNELIGGVLMYFQWVVPRIRQLQKKRKKKAK